MNDRIKQLRENSLKAVNRLSEERASLLTQFYKSPQAQELPQVIKRAKAFRYILQNKTVCILQNELIVGERGPEPKATPSYPEISLHSLQDLEILDKREKVSFSVSETMRTAYEQEIIPFWHGKSNRDKIMARLPQEWKEAYQAGVFTEFQEQRAPGHTVLDHKIYQKGMRDFQADIRKEIDQLNYHDDPQAHNKQNQLEAMHEAAEGLIDFGMRHHYQLLQLAETETNPERKVELQHMAAICKKVPAEAPTTFHEALQYYWFVHLGVITEVNPWDSFNPGRLDQHLLPFYQNEIQNGTLTKDQAKELLMAFWIKFNNQPAPPKMGVTAKESNTYTDFALINLGGLTPQGADAVNEVSYLLLDVIEEMRLLQPSSMVQLSKKNPDKFIHRALKISKTGFGQPSIFNTDALVQQMLNQGKSIEDARRGGASGCVETGAFGKEAYWLTGYFNLAKVLEITLNAGVDPRSGKKIGRTTSTNFNNFQEFMLAYQQQLEHFVNIKIKGNNIIESIIGQNLPVPFLSILIDDCIQTGRDYNSGGARYNTSYIQGVGMGTITDSLAAIKLHVFQNKVFSLNTFVKILNDNFEGHEQIQHELLNNTPKFGNDNDFADQCATQVFEIFHNAVNGRPTARGGKHRINLLPTTSHVYFGQMLLATPDGRKAGEALSEGISPVQGADRNGPTAVIRSMAKLDHLRTGGTLLNMKFAPEFFDGPTGIPYLGKLVRTYFRMDGHHIQFNVVDAKMLREAQQNPEKFTDLIVRVAGYSDYFNDLTPELQEEIIRRTEHC